MKGRLEAENIEVYIADNFTIDTDPLISNAIGGVKLFVRTSQLSEANKVLEDISRYSVNDIGQLIECLQCHSKMVDMVTSVKEGKPLFAFMFSLLIAAVLPVYTKYKYRCNECGNEFDVK